MEKPCPCGSNFSYIDCCQPYHQNKMLPPTPEALMRSRYSAYVLHLVDYLIDTTHPSKRYLHERNAISNWAKSNVWLRLEVLKAKDDKVEFKAFYQSNKQLNIHHELSTFMLEKGNWYYLTGSYFD